MRAPGRLFRVPYGHGDLEFMAQPWFDIDVMTPSAASIGTPYDIVVVGVGKPDDASLDRAVAAASAVALGPEPLVREGGAVIIPAQLDEGAGAGLEGEGFLAALEHARQGGRLVVVAASESPEIVRLAKMRAAVDVEEALDIAYEHIGRPSRASVLLIPRASEVGAERSTR